MDFGSLGVLHVETGEWINMQLYQYSELLIMFITQILETYSFFEKI
jgi:hypothetical protein